MTTGKAYGFFDCSASKEDIEAELPTVRDLAQTPSALELSLLEGPETLRGDTALLSIARDAQQASIKYVMKADLPDASNEKTAQELSGVLNQAYQTPLYEEDEPFSGRIVYEESGRYVDV